MKYTAKKCFSILLTLMLVLNMLPVSALSEGASIIPEGSSSILVGATPQGSNVFVEMEYHLDTDKSGLDDYYVVVGPFTGFVAQNVAEMEEGSNGFTVSEGALNEGYFVVLKQADSLEDARKQDSGNTVMYFSNTSGYNEYTGNKDFADGKYNVEWSKVSDHHYKMVITELVKSHKAVLTAPAGFDFSKLYIIFTQENNNRYVIMKVTEAREYDSGENFILAYQGGNTKPYDSKQATVVWLIASDEDLTLISPNDAWRFLNLPHYDGGEEYTVNIKPEGNRTTVDITPPTATLYQVRLKFFEQGATEATAHTLDPADHYTLEAETAGGIFTASLAGEISPDSSLVFSPDSAEELTKVSSWTFRKDGNLTDELDGYELESTAPEIQNGADEQHKFYVFNVRKPKEYSVIAHVYDAAGAIQTGVVFDGYTLTAFTDAGEYSGALAADRNPISLTGGGKNYLPKVSRFEVRDSANQAVTRVGAYRIVFPEETDPAEGQYEIRLVSPRICTATITFGDGATIPEAYDYYIVAFQNDSPAGYARIQTESMALVPFSNGALFRRFSRKTAANTIPVATGDGGQLTIDEDTAFNVVRVVAGTTVTQEALTSAAENDRVSSAAVSHGVGTIDDLSFSWGLKEGTEQPVYSFTVDTATYPEGTVRAVRINLYGFDDSTRVNDASADEDLKENLQGKKFVVVARLESKGPVDIPEKKIIGYQVQELPADGSGLYEAYFGGQFKGVHYNDSNPNYKYYEEEYNTVTYDAGSQDITIRLYEIKTGDSAMYAQYDAIRNYKDTITGYKFREQPYGNVTTGMRTDLNLHKAYPVRYSVKLHFDEPIELTEADDVCLQVTVSHASSSDDVYYGKVVGSGTEIEVVLEDQGQNPVMKKWTSGGSGLLTGNETFDVKIAIGSGGEYNSQAKSVVGENGTAVTYKVNYETTPRTEDDIAEEHITQITDHIDFTKIKASNDTNYLAILGQGVNFAITADNFEQKNHIQANFATNLYKSSPQPIEPDLNANSTGSVVIAKVDPEGSNIVQIGGKTPGTLLVYIDEDDLNSGVVLQDDSQKAVKIPSDGDYLKDNIVEPIISHMEKMSAALNQPATYVPSKPAGGTGNELIIDTMRFGDNDTIYIDGDQIKEYLSASDKLKILKKNGQTIVFNFDETETLDIGQFLCQVEKDDGTTTIIDSTSPVDSTDSKNGLIDKVAQGIVWNCRSCSTVNVTNSTGIFLLPQDNNTFDIKGTSSGWIISDGKVVNSGGEWHGVYRNQTSYDKASLNARKTIENNTPKASERFVFQIYRYDPLSPDAEEDGFKQLMDGTDPLEAENNGEAIAFTISEYEMGWNVYKIVESRVADGVTGSYTISNAVYYAEVEVKEQAGTNLTVVYPSLPTYYASFDTTTGRCTPDSLIEETPVFDNTINKEGLTLEKEVKGINAPDALFHFRVELWLEVTVTVENWEELGCTEKDIGHTVSVPVTGGHPVKKGENTETTTFETNADYPDHGVAIILLHQNETVKIEDLEIGTKYRVTEISTQTDDEALPVPFGEGNKSNGYTCTDRDAEGAIQEGVNASAKFVNQYESSDEISFRVKKELTHGSLKDHRFSFRLTQVRSEDELTQADTNVKLASPVTVSTTAGKAAQEEIVTLLSSLRFTQEDDGKTFWFLIEELVPEDAVDGVYEHVRYDDQSQRVIKVTVSDDKAGHLTIAKDPAPQTDNGTDIDATYTNDELGSVQVTKVFKNAPVFPENFSITASWTLGKESYEKTLKIGEGSDYPVSGGGTAAAPFIWTIPDLPVGTVVTFEESGLQIDGYTANVRINNTIVETGELTGTVTAALTPNKVQYINEYTRDKGSLRIRKITTVNGTERTDTTLVDGTYRFTVTSNEGVRPAINRTVEITITNGVVTAVKGADGAADPDACIEEVTEGGKTIRYAKVTNLPTGAYTVTEDTTGLEEKHIRLTESPENALTVVKDDTGNIPVGNFVNTYDAGELEISKTVNGTSDKSKIFAFTLTLTDGDHPLTGSYPVKDPDHMPGHAVATQTDLSGKTVTFDENGKATIYLKADEKLTITDLPQGAAYVVEEITEEGIMPSGYEQTAPADTAEGTISKTTSKAQFENDYCLQVVSVTFGGMKSIQGTDSTTKRFTFELYSADETYQTSGTPIRTCTSGTIGADGRTYAFEQITYDQDSVNQDYYYVIREKAFDESDPAEGWTVSGTEYRRHVHISDNGDGMLKATITEPDGTDEKESSAGGLNFINTYKAEGNITFTARKVFTNGKLSDHPFQITLKQVQGEGSEVQAVGSDTCKVVLNSAITKEVNSNTSTQTVTFGLDDAEKISFLKQKPSCDDTAYEYWFLLEETDLNPDRTGIVNDTQMKRWIRVTVSDNEDGTLKVEKSLAPVKDGETDLDAVFTNEQLGGVKAAKAFVLNGAVIPADFRITAKYTIDGTPYTKVLKINADATAGEIAPVNGAGTKEEPYVWELMNLPVGVPVTFEESGATVDGYACETTYEGFTAAQQMLTTAKDAPLGTYINTYTRETGDLEITKTVQVNGQTPATTADYALIDGTYTFRIRSAEGVAPATDQAFTVTVAQGKVTGAAFAGEAVNKIKISFDDAKATLSDLPTGQYSVTEELNDEQTRKGISLAGKPENLITIAADQTAGIPSADFINNIEIGDLEISKEVTGTTDNSKAFLFTVALTPPEGVELAAWYAAEKTDVSGVKTPMTVIVDSQTHQITTEISLRADEKIVILNLPGGTGYTVQEVTPLPDGYHKTRPSGDATGTIGGGLKTAAFVNAYELGTTSVAFGGVKTIAGTESTDKHFTFELYEITKAEYEAGGFTRNADQLIQTVTTDDTISTAGLSYSFRAITYDQDTLKDDQDRPIESKNFYYALVEKAFAPETAEGWTTSDVIYKRRVMVSDDHEGGLKRTVFKPADSGETQIDEETTDSLDFTNSYQATGDVSFRAKKVFTNGTIGENQFTFRLTQVTGEGSTTAAANPLIAQVTGHPAETQPVVAMGSASLVKNTETNPEGEYWFLLEEVIPEDAVNGISEGVRYDTSARKWIKVVISDNGDGTLKVEKSPAPTKDGDTDLDAVFENEQLGSVKVTKTFNLNGAELPSAFRITASYTEDNQTVTKMLKTGEGSDIVPTKAGTAAEPIYIWTISDLPIGTVVAFTETGLTVDGYSVTSTFTDAAGTESETTSGTVAAAKEPNTSAFVNTYTRDTGSLKIKKTVTVNGAAIGTNDTTLVDGAYLFTVTGKDLTAGMARTVRITISGGVAAEAELVNPPADNTVTVTLNEAKEALLEHLPTGFYDITETIDADTMTGKGIELDSPKPNLVTLEVTKDNTSDVPTAAFCNNRNIGSLEISKTVTYGNTEPPTSDTAFIFTLTLTPPTGVKLENTYPTDTSEGVRTANACISEEGILTLTDGTGGTKQAEISLKAGEKLKILQLPVGTDYTVTESTPPSGYRQTSPAGDATGNIQTNRTGTAAFINDYSTTDTSITFGGKKIIQGRDETTQVFTFELIETGADFTVTGNTPVIQTKKTSGTIRKDAGQDYSFDPIQYSEPGTHYYVIREKITGPSTNGWTNKTTEYHKTVTVTNVNSRMTAAVDPAGTDNLNFINEYAASGNISFQAQKVFTNGDLSDHPFKVTLMQVEGENSTVQAKDNIVLASPIIKTFNSGSEMKLTFGATAAEKISFTKNVNQDDTSFTYWFMIREEDDNPEETKTGIVNDANPARWIKVTLTDNGNGRLNVVREPAAQNGLDVVFTNEQRGAVKVMKVFAGDAVTVPDNFLITATYMDGEQEITKELRLNGGDIAPTGAGTAASPCTWEIGDLPLNTKVSFAESGMTVNGYALTTTLEGFTDDNGKQVLTAAKVAPEGTFINTYTRETGGLEITKAVTVNGSAPGTNADYALIDDTYTFRIRSAEGVTPATNQAFTVTVAQGKVTGAALVDPVVNGITISSDDARATLAGLPTGQYSVTEELSADQIKAGITLAKAPETGIEIASDQSAAVPAAAFTNNRDIGDLEISKKVNGTSDKTREFTFEVTLTLPSAPAGIAFAESYPAVITTGNGTNPVATTVAVSGGKITGIKLKADQQILIQNLPANTGYKVKETDKVPGYQQTSPSGEAVGNIKAGQVSSEEFVNLYNLGTTSVSFGGRKTISGTAATEQVFSFELYEITKEDYEAAGFNPDAGKLIQSVSTSGRIQSGNAGQTYSFDAITYDKNSLGEDATSRDFYYAVIEKAPNPANGWTTPSTVYKRHVLIKDSGSGAMNRTVYKPADSGETPIADDAADSLDFANSYIATGALDFCARKDFVNGTIGENQFTFRLTQVTGEGSTTAAANPLIAQVTGHPAETQPVVAMGSASLVKNTETNPEGEYWFLLEEVIPEDAVNGISEGVRYDTSARKWIKVVISDNGDGTLKTEKYPAPVKAGDTDLDAVFENEQLGSVKVTKTFNLNGAELPSAFRIMAAYTIGTTEYSKEFTTANAIKGSDGQVITDPYSWEIRDLPVDTPVTFTETGIAINGYSLTVTGAAKAADGKSAVAEPVQASVKPAVCELVNTYNRNTGSLRIRKSVTVNGEKTETDLMNGTFRFTVTGQGDVKGTNKEATVTIAGGKVTQVGGDAVPAEEDGIVYAELTGLPTGQYTVAEVLDADQLDAGITLTEEKDTTILVESDQTAGIPTAIFTNNRDFGELKISKKVLRSSNRGKEFLFTILLKKGSDPVSGTFPAAWKLNPGTAAKAAELSFTNGEATVTLHADEYVVISLIPKGISYTVTEDQTGMPAGYSQSYPADNKSEIGTIGTGLAEASFENIYTLKGTSLSFGGKKSIEVAGSTDRQFVFHLYETDDSYNIEGLEPLRTAVTENAISGKNATTFDFETITYEIPQSRDPNPDYTGYEETHYYAVCEEIIDDATGWKHSETLYTRKVTLKENDKGGLDKYIDDKLLATRGGVTGLDFTNVYEASGTVSFSVRKQFEKGDLSGHNFIIRLTEVEGKNQTKAVPGGISLEKVLNASGSEQTVTFDNAKTFHMRKLPDGTIQDDTKTEFWFMIEEIDPDPDPLVVMDPAPQRWISVTLNDLENGTLEVTKAPQAAAGEPDVAFTNEQLILVKVQKTDVTTGEELTGAHIQILDEDGKVVEEWDSVKGQPHEVTCLEIGKTYSLRETVAPVGYTVTADTCFTIGTDGKITSTDTTIREDGVLLVRDDLIRTGAVIRKIWADDGNRDGKRPLSLKAELLADGVKTGQFAVLSAENNWADQITGLPKMKDGRDIVYTWTEPAVPGYEPTGNVQNGTLTVLTNTHTPEKTSVSVKKVWVDDGTHPASVKVRLFADGQAASEEITLNAANNWTHTWTGLCRWTNPAGGATGAKEIVYKVAETEIPDGYVCKVTGNANTGFVITNTRETGRLVIEKEFDIEIPEEPVEDNSTTDLEVVKIWEDNDNKDGNRPKSITIHLFAGGEEIKTAELSEANGWKRHFGGLPKFVDGHPIHYSVTEDPVEWYVTEIHGLTIRNRYVPETTSVVVRKVWNDSGNQAHRPASVVMKLNNGMMVELNDRNGWTASISGLPARLNGKPAVYTWTEQSVMGYVMESSVTSGNVTTITNKPYEPETELGKPGKKTGMPENYVPIDDYSTALGLDAIINHVGDCFD